MTEPANITAIICLAVSLFVNIFQDSMMRRWRNLALSYEVQCKKCIDMSMGFMKKIESDSDRHRDQLVKIQELEAALFNAVITPTNAREPKDRDA